MRIAFLTDVFPRISNTFINNQITGLLDRGHEVDIFATSPGDFENAHEEVHAYRLRERMRHIPIPKNPIRRLARAAALARDADVRQAAALGSLNVFRHGSEGLNLSRFYTIASFLQRPPYDILHCQFGKLGPRVLPLLGSRARPGRLVTSFRGADLTSWVKRSPRMYDELFERGDLFLPVSQSFRHRLIDMGCDPERVHVLHSGIRLERFRYKERARRGEEPTRVLFVGRLTEKKGVTYALEAVARVLSSGVPLSFTVVGDGELRPQLEARARALGIAGSVEWAGDRSVDSVVEYMQRSHLLIAPSVISSDGGQEGIPNVLKEAMATGMPVLATTHSGIPELVEDGVSGFLVAERDVEALTQRLLEMTEHPELWPSLGLAGRQAVEAGFDIEKLNDRLVELYQQS